MQQPRSAQQTQEKEDTRAHTKNRRIETEQEWHLFLNLLSFHSYLKCERQIVHASTLVKACIFGLNNTR